MRRCASTPSRTTRTWRSRPTTGAIGTVALLGVPGNLAGPGRLWRATATSAADVEERLRDAWLAARSNLA